MLDGRLRGLIAGDPECIADAFAVYAELREAGRFHEIDGMILAGHYRDVGEILRDDTRFSNAASTEGSRVDRIRAGLGPAERAALEEHGAFKSALMSNADGERHARLRAISHRAFTPRRIAALEAKAQSYLDGLLEPLQEDATTDLMTVVWRFPLFVVCDLMGVPATDIDRVHAWSQRISANHGAVHADLLMDSVAALREFREYVDGLLDEHRRAPNEDGLLAALVGAQHSDQMTAHELASFVLLLFFAGHETTTNAISVGLLELQRHRDQWQALCDDPSLAAGAVNEILRYVSPLQVLDRRATEDVDLDGLAVPRGTTVMALLASGNRDPDAFPDPDRLLLGRPESSQLLTFGYGVHYCLGASLARLELALAFKTLAERFPGIELAGDPAWRGSFQLRQLKSLPVVLRADRSRSRRVGGRSATRRLH